MEEWVEIIKHFAPTADNVSAIARIVVERALDTPPAPGLSPYQRRVRNRKRIGNYRPEWDLIGRVSYRKTGELIFAEMDYVPPHIVNLKDNMVRTQTIGPGPKNAVQTTDEDHIHLVELLIGPNLQYSFLFWRRPA